MQVQYLLGIRQISVKFGQIGRNKTSSNNNQEYNQNRKRIRQRNLF